MNQHALIAYKLCFFQYSFCILYSFDLQIKQLNLCQSSKIIYLTKCRREQCGIVHSYR